MDHFLSVLLAVIVVALTFARPLRRFLRLGRGKGRGWRTRDVSDVSVQLALVSAVAFERQPLLNKGEFRVLLVLEEVVRDLRAGYRAMAQASLGEFLRPRFGGNAEDAELAYRSINSKRSDFIIVDRRGFAVLAVEYQGDGHYQGSAVQRDAVKRLVFRSAGVMLIEVPARFDAGALAREVREALRVAEGADVVDNSLRRS